MGALPQIGHRAGVNQAGESRSYDTVPEVAGESFRQFLRGLSFEELSALADDTGAVNRALLSELNERLEDVERQAVAS